MDLQTWLLTNVIIGCLLVIQAWAQPGYCTKIITIQMTVSVQVSTTRTITSYYKCYLFWTCTRYRTTTAYKADTQQRLHYASSPICCVGFHFDDIQGCVADIVEASPVPVTTWSTYTQNGTRDHSEFPPTVRDFTDYTTNANTTVSNTTMITLNANTKSTTSETFPSNSNKITDMPPAGAIIMLVFLILLAIVVIALVVGCLAYRRRKRQERSERIDRLHMEPLGNIQLLSKHVIQVQHFTPQFAPDDEYAVVDKRKLAGMHTGANTYGEAAHNYENALIFDVQNGDDTKTRENRTSLISIIVKKMKGQKSTNLTHTYMEGPVRESGIQDPDKHVTLRDNTRTENCYSEVDSDVDCVTIKEENTGNDETDKFARDSSKQFVYDHLDRDEKTNQGARQGTPSKYGTENQTSKTCDVLVHTESSEVSNPHNILQRTESKVSESEAELSGTSGYGTLATLPSPGPTGNALMPHPSRCTTDLFDVYDNLDRGLSFTSNHKAHEMLDNLYRASDSTGYGRIETYDQQRRETGTRSSHGGAEHDGQDSESEPLYLSQDSVLKVAGGAETTDSYLADNQKSTTIPNTGSKGTLTDCNSAVVEGATNQLPGQTNNYSLIVDSQMKAYDTMKRRIDGGTLSTPKGESQSAATNRGQDNAAVIYENM